MDYSVTVCYVCVSDYLDPCKCVDVHSRIAYCPYISLQSFIHQLSTFCRLCAAHTYPTHLYTHILSPRMSTNAAMIAYHCNIVQRGLGSSFET